ncbi:MAG: ATP synthase F1 subunit gamma [Planctomycetaceae bacterium]|nr:ATP synthase F1 subunit gamma [Planctomycetota bacterium]NUN51504.1 ATP synthase F1 subunit gamma [Planctomycetaceae bacterium]
MPVNTKAIRKRIKSVSSTRKITKTMEMVATSKLKRAQDAVVSSTPYSNLLVSMMNDLASRVADRSGFPLLRRAEKPERTLIFIVTASRGLCGGFNSNLVRLGRDTVRAEIAAGRKPVVHMAGKKGIAAFRFQEIPVDRKVLDLSDRPTYEEAERLAESLTGPFLAGEVDRVLVVYPDFRSLASQPPTVLQLCPVGDPGAAGAKAGEAKPGAPAEEFLFDPSPRAILEKLLPLYVRTTVYRVLVSAVASEQIARRTAMKLATDNAGEMVTNLTRAYNKARQAQITQEIAEIIGGAEALKK